MLRLKMINEYTQNKNENVIYREKRKTMLSKDNFDTTGLYEKIINELNKSEKIYNFPNSEEKIVNVYNKNSYNPFFMHDEQMYFLFQKIFSVVKDVCKENDFSYSKNKYFIYSSFVEDQDLSFWYDAGGTSRPSMFGIISLDKQKTKISINDTDLEVNLGDIIVSEAGNKIVYYNKFKSIVFYVSPLSEIKNQYSQKWMPLI
jgi:hypothetical protein